MIPDAVVSASSSFLAHLAEPAARALVLGCLAAIVLAVFRVKRVSLRILAWTTVLYGALAIALVGWLLPGVPLRVPGAVTLERIVAANHSVASAVRMMDEFVFAGKTKGTQEANEARDLASRVELPRTSLGPRYARERKERADASSAQSLPAQPRLKLAEKQSGAEFRQSSANPAGIRQADRRTPKKAISWVVVGAGIYLAVAFLLLARLLLGLFLSHRLARLSVAISDADTLRRLRFRTYASGLETVPRLAESELVSVPATLGVFRPVILLPVDWREWDEAKFDAILAHEVSHVARRDALTQRISLLHRAIFWFSPLSWWLDRKLNELAEEASDEAALGAGVDQKCYAETLVGFFADLAAASGRVWWQGVSMASDGSRAGHAERRVERILAWGGSISMKKSLAVALVAFAAPVIFLAAAVHPVIVHGQSGQDKTQSDSKNVVMPGGPKAPALPKAPKGGVTAPAPLAPIAVPALMPVPGAPAHPPIVPGPIAGGPATPGTAPVAAAMAGAPQSGVVTPPTPPAPAPALAPSGWKRTFASIASVPAIAPLAPGAPVSAELPPTPQSVGSSDVQEAEKEVRAAEKQLKEAETASRPDDVREAQEAVKDAEEALAEAQAAMKEEQAQGATIINGSFNSGWGPRYVMMSANSSEVSMSGSEEDLQHARNLRKKISGDFIWFEHDEKSYIITDQNFVAKAKALFAPEEALAKQQDELGRQQDELGRQQDALGEKMEGVKVKIRDITPELEQIRARMKELEATGATQEELGRLQSRLGELQSEVGHSQSEAGVGQSEIGRRQGELGRKQGELGRRQGELGRQQGELAKKASLQLRQMFEDAIAKGTAKPE
jgi:beta-lactamase regulating signal transducer with metallopeptidase domain